MDFWIWVWITNRGTYGTVVSRGTVVARTLAIYIIYRHISGSLLEALQMVDKDWIWIIFNFYYAAQLGYVQEQWAQGVLKKLLMLAQLFYVN